MIATQENKTIPYYTQFYPSYRELNVYEFSQKENVKSKKCEPTLDIHYKYLSRINKKLETKVEKLSILLEEEEKNND